MKICKECLIDKELSEFYIHPKGVMGTLPRCKECICKGRKTERELIMSRISDKKRQGTEKRKLFGKTRLVEYRKRNPEKHKAQSLVANYFRTRKELKPTTCIVSGTEGGIIHLHHFDYSKPNCVIPCTPKIHSDFHQGKITEIKEEWILILPF